MALIATDWSVATNGDIRYTGAAHGVAGASYATVIEFHRWLQDLADDASAISANNDILDITDTTPSERSTDNIITLYDYSGSGGITYNIDQTAAEHLYDGSIIQNNGADIWDGIVNYGNEGIDIQVIQNGALESNDFWNSTPDGEALPGLNREVTAGISHRFMIKVRTSGSDVDGRRLIGISREYGKTYSEFSINGTSRGNNVFALTNSNDLNNETAEGTVATWTSITNTEGYRAIDVDNNLTPEYYYSEWNRDVYTINQFYERTKWLTRTGTVSTLYGIDAGIFRGITHELTVTPGTGTWVEPESISWTGGTGQVLAVDDTDATATTKIWIQILTGLAPSSGTVTGNGGATATVTGLTERPVNPEFIGTSTGSAIIGHYGVGIEATDLTSADKVFDLTNTQVTPPDYRVTTVGGLVHDEDRVLVGPDTGSTALQFDQLAVSTGLTGGETSIVLKTGSETIGTGTQFASDTPGSGTIRVFDDNGVAWRIPYSAVTHGSGIATFTVQSGDTTGLTAAVDNDAFVSYIDKDAIGSIINSDSLVIGVEYEILTVVGDDYTTVGAANNTVGTRFIATGTDAGGTGTVYAVSTSASFTAVYHSPRTLFVRVRDGGVDKGDTPIKTFESSVSLGGTVSAIRTNDY